MKYIVVILASLFFGGLAACEPRSDRVTVTDAGGNDSSEGY